jgi:hypothetical protein
MKLKSWMILMIIGLGSGTSQAAQVNSISEQCSQGCFCIPCCGPVVCGNNEPKISKVEASDESNPLPNVGNADKAN